MYKRIRELRCKRREIKNKLATIGIVLSKLTTEQEIEEINNILAGMSNSTYTPKVNVDLFRGKEFI